MGDIVDRVLEDNVNEIALNNLNSKVITESSHYCQNDFCGEEIPEARRKLGGVTLCIDCQSIKEKYPNLKYNTNEAFINPFTLIKWKVK